MPLYLTVIQRLRLTSDFLADIVCTLEDFLCAPFANIRSPAPILALKDFCEFVWRESEETAHRFPETLKLHLAAWYDVCGGNRPGFLPGPSQSQAQFENMVRLYAYDVE